MTGISNGYDYLNMDLTTSQPPSNHPLPKINRNFSWYAQRYPKVLTPTKLLDDFHFTVAQHLGDYGSGEKIVLIEKGNGYFPNAINVFDKTMGLVNRSSFVSVVKIGKPKRGYDMETTADIDWLHAVVPLAHLYVIELPDSFSVETIYSAVKKIHPNAVSVSLNVSGNLGTIAARLNGDGFSFIWNLSKTVPVFVASGDNGQQLGIDACPTIVSVGGLQLSSGGKISPWTDGGTAYADFAVYRPMWQFDNPSIWRATPDVSFIAGPPYYWVYLKQWDRKQGTSFSTPIWAGIWALADDAYFKRSGHHLPTDANEILYQLAQHDKKAFQPILTKSGQYNIQSGLGIPNVPQIVKDISDSKNFPKHLKYNDILETEPLEIASFILIYIILFFAFLRSKHVLIFTNANITATLLMMPFAHEIGGSSDLIPNMELRNQLVFTSSLTVSLLLTIIFALTLWISQHNRPENST